MAVHADSLDGGTGSADRVDYSNAPAAGVMINLETGLGAGGEAAGDTYSGIERAMGSNQSDRITGNAAANILYGVSGDDRLQGRDGADVLYGGWGDDILEGGAGPDFMDGDIEYGPLTGPVSISCPMHPRMRASPWISSQEWPSEETRRATSSSMSKALSARGSATN